MPPLSKDELKIILLRWRDEIAPSQEAIRRAQDQVLLEVGPENMDYAITVMAAILGKGGLTVTNNNTTNIANAGVAMTGGTVHGGVAGIARDNTATISSQISEGLETLKAAIADAPELSHDEKENARTAVEDIEEEVKKPEGERRMGRVRNAIETVTKIAGTVEGIKTVYDLVSPYLATFFHLTK
jgi:hypothetical protein